MTTWPLEIYECEAGEPLPSTNDCIDILQVPPGEAAPQKGDLLTFALPGGSGHKFVTFEVVARRLRWYSPGRTDDQQPQEFQKMWLYVRRWKE